MVYNSYDPSDIFKDVIDKYRALGGSIDYTASSIDDTNTTVSYTFECKTIREVIDKIIELAPKRWYYRIDPDGIIHFHEFNDVSITPDHIVSTGNEVTAIRATQDIENIVNKVYFVGGVNGETQLYKLQTRSSSIATYGAHAMRKIDERVTVAGTATAMMTRILDLNDSPLLVFNLELTDNNGTDSTKGYDIESLKPGQMIQVRGLYTTELDVSRWGVAIWGVNYLKYQTDYELTLPQVIHSVHYMYDSVMLEATNILPLVPKRIEDINRNLEASETINLPTSPT